jgi:kanamycin nucleotidyltransferase
LIGPHSINQDARREISRSIARAFQERLSDRLLAIGVYGSIARDLDGPYSDIEMYCVLREGDADKSLEWVAGSWKAEVAVIGQATLLALASEVDDRWPIVAGCYLDIWSLYDPEGFFPLLRQTVLSQPETKFAKAIQVLIVDEIFEMIGKIRNSVAMGNIQIMPYYTVQLALQGAQLAGLANRHAYAGKNRIFETSLTLPELPDGYASLCQIVMQGELNNPGRLAKLADEFWKGVIEWVTYRNIRIMQDLETMLASIA